MVSPAVLVQYLTSQHLVSRLTGALAKCSWPWLKDPLIRLFIRWFDVDMDEAEVRRPEQFRDFNDFFTRSLKPGLRPICAEAGAVISPVDGVVSQIGRIDRVQLLQAKGLHYSLHALLGHSDERAERFHDGLFATFYLSPRDYHRVHAPFSGNLVESVYIPGRLFSVNSTTSGQVPMLYAKNERLVTLFETSIGWMGVVMVGAIVVAGIETVWHDGIYPAGTLTEDPCEGRLHIGRGEEMGRFKLGSTVIVLLQRDCATWSGELAPGRVVRVGQRIATAVG